MIINKSDIVKLSEQQIIQFLQQVGVALLRRGAYREVVKPALRADGWEFDGDSIVYKADGKNWDKSVWRKGDRTITVEYSVPAYTNDNGFVVKGHRLTIS